MKQIKLNTMFIKSFDDFIQTLKVKGIQMHPTFMIRTVAKLRTDHGNCLTHVVVENAIRTRNLELLDIFLELGLPLYEARESTVMRTVYD